jgi:hypothetical protein
MFDVAPLRLVNNTIKLQFNTSYSRKRLRTTAVLASGTHEEKTQYYGTDTGM